MSFSFPLTLTEVQRALEHQSLSLSNPTVNKTVHVMLALMSSKKLVPLHYLLADKVERAESAERLQAAAAHAPSLALHRFYDQAIELATLCFEEPTDEHIEAIAQRLLWNAQRGHQTEQGAASIH